MQYLRYSFCRATGNCSDQIGGKRSMTREKNSDITIHLNNIHDLFITPTDNPFSAKAHFVSGIELIKSELKSRSWGLEERTRTTIFLPKESIEPNLAEKTKIALQRFCQFKVQQNKDATARLRRSASWLCWLASCFWWVGFTYHLFWGD